MGYKNLEPLYISSKVDDMNSSASTVHNSIESRFFYVHTKYTSSSQCIKSTFECISPAAQKCNGRMPRRDENDWCSGKPFIIRHHKTTLQIHTISSFSPAFSFSKLSYMLLKDSHLYNIELRKSVHLHSTSIELTLAWKAWDIYSNLDIKVRYSVVSYVKRHIFGLTEK